MTPEQWIDLAKRAIDVARASDDPATRAAGERLHAEELHGTERPPASVEGAR